jgi:DNA-directed RNA polymerase specialized sigma24 family protein
MKAMKRSGKRFVVPHPGQAQAVALYYLEDYSVREISAVLDCQRSTVKTHLSRARDAAARHLQLEDPQ